MLKAMREMALPLYHLPDAAALRAGLRSTLRFAALAGAAFLLSRAVVGSIAPACGLAPFALALFAAALSAGLNPAPLAAGCALGGLRGSLEVFNLALLIGCAVILAGWLACGMLPEGVERARQALGRAPSFQARSPNGARRCMVLAGLGTLLPGLAWARGALWPSVQATAAAVASLSAAPFMAETLRAVGAGRRHSGADARTGLCLLALSAVAGVCALWLPAGLGLAALAVTLSWPAGALAGLGFGASALLMTGDGRYAAALGLCGAAAQLWEGRDAGRAALVSAAGLAGALFMGLSYPALAGLCLGPTLALLVPEGLRARWLSGFRRAGSGCDPDRLAALLREDAAERLRAMSAAFGELAEGYVSPAAMPDEQALMTNLREALCDGCPNYGECWAGGENRGARLLCDLVALAVEQEGDLFEEGMPPDLQRRCRRSRAFEARVGGPLREYADARRATLRRGGQNRLISAQFLQARALLDGLAAEQSAPVRLRDAPARRVRSALARADIDVAEVLDIPGRRRGLALTLWEGRWTEPGAAMAAKCLGGYGVSGMWGNTLRLTRRTKLTALVGAVSASREPGAASGDSHLTAMLDDDRLLALICDGMGSGEAAGRESARAARLLGRFLAAGAGWGLAVETVNALLVNSAEEDMFSTMDLLILNLTTGMAELIKLSACPTLIAREGEVRRVEGGRLPLGILDQVQPAASRVRLMPGDVLLMASDGVMDAADPDETERLLTHADGDMNALSEQILALAQSAAHRPDDMTAICLRVESDSG